MAGEPGRWKPSTCPDCSPGTPGFILVHDPGDGGPRSFKKCPHRGGPVGDPTDRLRAAGAPERELAYTEAGLTLPQQSAIPVIENHLANGCDVYVFGPNGTGKTGACVLVLRRAVERNVRVGYVYADDLVGELRSGFKEGQQREGARTEAEVHAALLKPDLLFINELPTYRVTDLTRQSLTTLIDRRAAADRRTLIDGNPELEGVEDRGSPGLALAPDQDGPPSIDYLYGSTFADRLRAYGYVPLRGASRRRAPTPADRRAS